ncbi:poly(A) polymerase type 3-like [Ostrinia furnacalis]|uniref:poly(A) polymerase type 3-like n=1 Tax=Ostrinia furnacalis TaxID=93504 RepID=UPI0010393091|nr:poly(A) polymerase type 3-like [Ostrinia furnacalis]
MIPGRTPRSSYFPRQRRARMWPASQYHSGAHQPGKPNEHQNQQNLKTLGMTSAISMAGPKPIDIEKTNELKESLVPFNVFESEDEMHHRMEVLGSLHRLVRQWIRDESLRKNMPPNVAETVGGNIYTFGSYRLGVSGPKTPCMVLASSYPAV